MVHSSYVVLEYVVFDVFDFHSDGKAFGPAMKDSV